MVPCPGTNAACIEGYHVCETGCLESIHGATYIPPHVLDVSKLQHTHGGEEMGSKTWSARALVDPLQLWGSKPRAWLRVFRRGLVGLGPWVYVSRFFQSVRCSHRAFFLGIAGVLGVFLPVDWAGIEFLSSWSFRLVPKCDVYICSGNP
jgi:hypothetical protein